MRHAFYNGLVYTGQLPLQQAFLVEDGRFAFVGDSSDVLAMAPEKTTDLKGRFVCAGFNDSHMHLLSFGNALSVAPLSEHTYTLEDMIACLQAAQPGRGGWILGRGWNQDLFRDVNRMPNRYDLDKVSVTHPVCAVRACGHALCLNSLALQTLGITGDTPQPEGGEISMENGEPNGLLFDNAMLLAQEKIPSPEKDDIIQMLRKACMAVNAMGITSCQSDDYSAFQNLPWETVNEAFRELEASGELTVRVYEQANFPKKEELESFIAAGNRTGIGSDYFRVGPLKLLGDGALGARTAFLSKPYADAPDTKGLSVFSQEEFDALIGCANENGMQVAVHCIGDACLDMVIEALRKALSENPRDNHRHGIVHCQITRPDQLDALAQMRLHIYAQSIFLDYDIHIVKARCGEALASSSYSWKTLMNKGCTVSNGSDCPVEYPNVMKGIQCAVTRRDLKGHGPYLESEAFTVREALDSFTKAGAYSSFEENIKGQIIPGMLADFVILGDNPFTADPPKLKDIPIFSAWLGGKQVFSR